MADDKITELQKKLDAMVEKFKTSLTPLEDTIKTVKGMSDTLSIGIGALNRKVLDLSKDVGSLKDLVDSNKGLSDKVEELTKSNGKIYTLEAQITHIKGLVDGTQKDTGLFQAIDHHFTELMGS